jgi:Zn-dependent protease with chaperone function
VDEERTSGSGRSVVLIVLLLPVLVWLTGACARGHLNDQLYQLAQQELGPVRAVAVRDQLRLELLCRQPELRDEDWCSFYRAAGWLQWGAVATALLGLGLLGFVAERASQARQHADRLPELFRQAVRTTGIGAAVLGLGLATLVAGALALSMLVYLEAIWGGLILGVFLLGGYAALRAARAALAWGKPLEHSELAVRVTRTAAPALWQLVDQVARSVGTNPPDNVLLALEPNCYAIEVPVHTSDGTVQGRTLCLSLTLLRLWDEDELRAVVAHELAHFYGEDTRYSREYAPSFRAAAEALATLQAALGRDVRAFAVFPLVPLFAYTLERFARATAAHSRQRELVADATAARVAGNWATATALVKVAVAAPAWDRYLDRLLEERDRTPPPASAAVAWLTETALREGTPPDRLATDRITHPVDTHPPLVQRLEALGTPLREVWLEALPPEQPASALVPDADEIDAALSRQLMNVAALLQRLRAAAQSRDTSRSRT